MKNWFASHLENEKVSLNPIEAKDFPRLKDLLNDTATMRDLIPYFGTSVWTDQMVRDRYEKFLQQESLRQSKSYVVQTRTDPNIVGNCGFKNINWQEREAEFGIILHRSVWGQGLATSCVRLCLQDAFEAVGLRRVVFITTPQNKNAQNSLAKTGAKPVHNANPDVLEYEILAGDWPVVKTNLV